MRYYLIAGEASGDLHASNLMSALKEQDAAADFRFIGGDLMRSVGGTMMKHYRDIAYMGILPVIRHLGTILHAMDNCRKDIRSYHPDAVILIDYPGFNLKIAEYVKKELHLPVFYYISPKIWAWKQYRIGAIRKYVDRMFCILPFETAFYRQLHYDVDYVGNPSVDSASRFMNSPAGNGPLIPSEKPILALLSGSRRQEIKDNLPTMIAVAKRHPEFTPIIAGAPSIDPEYYAKYNTGGYAQIVYDKTYLLLHSCKFALVTSGTATLETALFRVPQIVCYYFWGKKTVNFIYDHFFHAPYISLVNLIAGKTVVQELFGGKFSVKSIDAELSRLIHDDDYRKQMLQGYDEIIRILGSPGASTRTASHIYKFVETQRAASPNQQ